MRDAATRQPRSGTGPRGFTLLELVLVMLLLTTMLAMAVPSLRGFLGASRARDAVSQLVSLAQYAKARAAADAAVFRLHAGGTSYWLTVQEGTQDVPVPSDFGRRFELPQGMTVEVVPGGGTARLAEAGRVSFYANGRTSAGVFRLTDADGVVTLLAAPSPAEAFRVVSAEEAARL